MVIQESRSVEERLGQLFDLVQSLTRRVDELSRRLGATEAAPPAGEAAAPSPDRGAAEPSSPSMMSWVGESSVLPRIAMISFALVVALVMRTLTDSRLIGVEVGVALGIAYSILLVALGYWLLVHRRRGQRVLPSCGAVLLCSVALEAHRKFQLVSVGTVHWILIADLLVVGAIGMRFRMGSIVAFAVLAPLGSALAVDFPNLCFPLGAAVVLLANGLAYVARRLGRLDWLSWVTFFATTFFWLLWSLKARAQLLNPAPAPVPGLGVDWFLPWLAAFALFYAVTAVLRTVAEPRSPGAFHAFLPMGNALWAHPAAVAVAAPLAGGLSGVAAFALGAAAAHLAFAAWLWRRLREHATGITSFTLAGSVLLALAVVTLANSLPLLVAVFAALALGLALFAALCGSTGLRLWALLLQIAVCVVTLVGDLYAVPPGSLTHSLSAGIAVAALGSWHYLHDRKHPPQAGSWFAAVDAKGHSSILLLWSAALAAFGSLRLLLHALLGALGTTSPDAYPCGQSVILNCSSIALLLWGLHTGNRQAQLTAVLVAVVGGIKVFGSDLLNASGLPLVLSVFSFGVAAAVGSRVLAKLQRAAGAAPPG